jgi:hypothetical protein
METHPLKFLANFQYEAWAYEIYTYYSFSGDMNKLISLLSLPQAKATEKIKNSLVSQYPEQPEEVLELVAEQNLKELLKVFRKFEFAVAN